MIMPLGMEGAQGLMPVDLSVFSSGVYFLCLSDEVVYVGQSRCVPGRIRDHLLEGKKRFDSVYALMVPVEKLNEVESSFAHYLKPKENGKHRGEAQKPFVPFCARPIADVLADYGEFPSWGDVLKKKVSKVLVSRLDKPLSLPPSNCCVKESVAASFLGVSVLAIRENRRRNSTDTSGLPPIPYFKYGSRTVRYLVSDLEEAISKMRGSVPNDLAQAIKSADQMEIAS